MTIGLADQRCGDILYPLCGGICTAHLYTQMQLTRPWWYSYWSDSSLTLSFMDAEVGSQNSWDFWSLADLESSMLFQERKFQWCPKEKVAMANCTRPVDFASRLWKTGREGLYYCQPHPLIDDRCSIRFDMRRLYRVCHAAQNVR